MWCVLLSYASYVSLYLVHSYFHLWFVLLSYVSYVLVCLVHSDCFLHPMFYIFYSVMYNQDMFFFPCNMFSVCSVHPLICGVLSTRRLWYATPPLKLVTSDNSNYKSCSDELTMSQWKSKWQDMTSPFLFVLLSHHSFLSLVELTKKYSYSKVHLYMTSNMIL
jgi:hypothetical protein